MSLAANYAIEARCGIDLPEGSRPPKEKKPKVPEGEEAKAEADADGNFSVHYGLPLTLPNMQVVLTVTATDAEGNRSIPTMVRVKF